MRGSSTCVHLEIRHQVVRRPSINIIGQFAGRERMWRIPEFDSRSSRLRQLGQLAQTGWPGRLDSD